MSPLPQRADGYSLKLVLQIAAGALIAGMVIWIGADPSGFRHKVFGYSQTEINDSWHEVAKEQERISGTSVDETQQQAEAKDVAYKVEAIEMMYGKSVAAAYRACHSSAPKSEKQEADCRRLEHKIVQGQ